ARAPRRGREPVLRSPSTRRADAPAEAHRHDPVAERRRRAHLRAYLQLSGETRRGHKPAGSQPHPRTGTTAATTATRSIGLFVLLCERGMTAPCYAMERADRGERWAFACITSTTSVRR